MSKNQMQPILRAFFEEYLPDVKGVSANTLRSYRYSFRLLFQFLYEKNGILPAKVDFSNLDGNTVLSFLQWLEESRECSVSTRNQRLAAIRSFSSYASRHCFQSALAFGTAVASMRAMELPGLWNGAMARWNTVFVEVPISTFAPVKIVNDLLRPQHQNEP